MPSLHTDRCGNWYTINHVRFHSLSLTENYYIANQGQTTHTTNPHLRTKIQRRHSSIQMILSSFNIQVQGREFECTKRQIDLAG